MNYGVVISEYKIETKTIFKYFNDYFNSPTMTKIKDVGLFSMYMSKLYCLLSKECRYLVVFVKTDTNQIGYNEQLINLDWVSFQTRTLNSDEYTGISMKNHSYEVVGKGPLLAEIVRDSITPEASLYKCKDLDIVVTLLHTEKNTKEVYRDAGNVISALETFQTIVTFEE